MVPAFKRSTGILVNRGLEDKTLEHDKNIELEELKYRGLKDRKISLWSIRP
jgi:hypothetical protein